MIRVIRTLRNLFINQMSTHKADEEEHAEEDVEVFFCPLTLVCSRETKPNNLERVAPYLISKYNHYNVCP